MLAACFPMGIVYFRELSEQISPCLHTLCVLIVSGAVLRLTLIKMHSAMPLHGVAWLNIEF